MSQVDKTKPEGKWEFDAEVTDCFDDMLARSIPQYDVMRGLCHDLACNFRKPKTDIVDLGCSRGAAMASLVRQFGAYNRFVGVEVSEPMRTACEKRFQGMMDVGIVDVTDVDLREAYPPVAASVTLAVLTIQFTPIEYRQRILKNIYETTLPGGALIMVEKILGSTAELDELMVKRYYEKKKESGYTEEDINRKRLSLEGVLVPLTAEHNESLLRKTGFTKVDCFWRWMNFAGWVAVR